MASVLRMFGNRFAFISVVISLVLGLSLLASGCGAASTTSAPASRYHETPFIASDFVDPRVGSNKWFPLVPGTQWVREGTTLIGNRWCPTR